MKGQSPKALPSAAALQKSSMSGSIRPGPALGMSASTGSFFSVCDGAVAQSRTNQSIMRVVNSGGGGLDVDMIGSILKSIYFTTPGTKKRYLV